jgi:hypothetical protein
MKLKEACKKPCKGCPFARHVKPGELGGSPVEVYVGQAHLKMWLPCHAEREYADKESVNKMDVTGQCSGAARLRKKLAKKWDIDFDPIATQDDPDNLGFNSIEEFVEHHTQQKLGVEHIDSDVISLYMHIEMQKVKDNAHRCVRKVEVE